MLTGEPPFTADSSAALAYRHVHDVPETPSARRPGLPPQVDGLVLRLLAKDPVAPPASAAPPPAGLIPVASPDSPRALAAMTEPHAPPPTPPPPPPPPA